MGGGPSKATEDSRWSSGILLDDASDQSDDDDADCQFCSFLRPKNNTCDSFSLGTPVPDTPLNQRLKRRQLMQEQRNDPEFSSRYDGLEKERSMSAIRGSSGSILIPPAPPAPAQVHQGEDAERLLHDKYELQQVLGVGSTSTCHKCVLRSTGQAFAAKVIDKEHIAEQFSGMMDQFHCEINALRNLNHPNIIKLNDVYVTESRIYIVMELMEGGELFDYVVEKGTLNEEEAARIVRKVTSALVYMHSKDIIHRDLKPENLLLKQKTKSSRDLEVKIIDFGLSKRMVEPVARSFLGTRGYLAPEMLQRRDYSEAVDTWALGVIAFVLLCGCLPFDDDSQTVPSDALVKQRFVLRFPRWAKDLSESAKDLLSHLLDIDPSKRYTAEQALQHDWVQGTTALSSRMLESPGRIIKHKTPPMMKPPESTTGPSSTTKQYVIQNYSRRRQANGSHSATPTRMLVRKTSI